MKYTYRTKGTCSAEIIIELDDNSIVRHVEYLGGCNGNLKGISKLVEGMDAERVIEILKGNQCGFRATSCADQFAIALRSALDGVLAPCEE